MEETVEVKVPRAHRFGDWSRALRMQPSPVLKVRVPHHAAHLANAAAKKGYWRFSAWLRSQPWAQEYKRELECSAVTPADDVEVLLGKREESIALDPAEMQEGDLFIVTDMRDRKSLVNLIITSAHSSQALLFGKGQAQSVHAGIIALGRNGKPCIVDVTGKGCHVKEIPERFPYNVYCYRMLDPTISKLASKIALECAEGENMVEDEEHPKEEEEEYFDANIVDPSDNKKSEEVTYSVLGTVRSVVFPQLLSRHHYKSKAVHPRTFCSKFVIECMQVAQHRHKKLLRAQGVNVTQEMKQEIESSFWIERTSTVRALEHYLRFNALFRRFVVPSSDNLFQELIVETVLPIAERDNEDALACVHDLIAEVEMFDLKSLGKEFDLCCLVLRQCVPLFSKAESKTTVMKAARKLGGLESQDIEDFRLNSLKQKCFAAVEAAANMEKEEESLTLSYMGC